MTVPNAPRLCPACLLNLGYWTHPQGFCPTCAAMDREAGE
jgi:hypothetical protein